MGVVVDFTYTDWLGVYPQFTSTVTQSAFDLTIFPLTTNFCANDGSGQASTAAIQTNLLGLMASHIAQLLFGTPAQPVSPLVGRINSASEGSVSVGVDMPTTGNPTQAWLYQTQYGATYWALTAPYRTMHYRPGPRRVFNPWPNQ